MTYDHMLQLPLRAAAAAAVGAGVCRLFGMPPEVPASLAAIGAALPALLDRLPAAAPHPVASAQFNAIYTGRASGTGWTSLLLWGHKPGTPWPWQQPGGDPASLGARRGKRNAVLFLLAWFAFLYLWLIRDWRLPDVPAALEQPIVTAATAIAAAWALGLAFRKFHLLRCLEHNVAAAAALPVAALVLGHEHLAWVAAGYGIHLLMDALSDQGVVLWNRRYAARLIPSTAWAGVAALILFSSAAAAFIWPQWIGQPDAFIPALDGGQMPLGMLLVGIVWGSLAASSIALAIRRRKRTGALVWPVQEADKIRAMESCIDINVHPSWLKTMPFVPVIAVWKIDEQGHLAASVLAVEPGPGCGPWPLANRFTAKMGAPAALNVARYGPGSSDAWVGVRLPEPIVFTQGHAVDLLATAAFQAANRGHRMVGVLHLVKALYLTSSEQEPDWVEAGLARLPAVAPLPPNTALPLSPQAARVLSAAQRRMRRSGAPEGALWKHVFLALLDLHRHPGTACIRELSMFDAPAMTDYIARIPDPDPEIVACEQRGDTAMPHQNAPYPRQGANDHAGGPGSHPQGGASAREAQGTQDLPWAYKGDALREMCTDLVDQAKRKMLPPVVGREAEFEQMLRTLLKAERPNPVLVGEAGTGKTAVVHLLAHKLARDRSSLPSRLRKSRLLELNVGALEANTGVRGSFEARLDKLISQLEGNPDIILFVDEIHLLVGAGQAELGAVPGAGQRLKPALSSGRIRVIGATTPHEYRVIEKDPALDRRFHLLTVDEPSPDLVKRTMMPAIADHLSKHHGVAITPDALEAAVDLTVRYVPDKRLPAKAKEALDAACAGAVLRGDQTVTAADIRTQVSLDTKIPIEPPDQEEAIGIRKLAQRLSERVFGQDTAVSEIANAILRYRAGLSDERKPIGVFLFYGPTGVGKTELAKAAAAELFGSDKAMARLDMSEFYDRYTVSRLVGAPPGYMGHDQGGQLTEQVRKKRHCVVLLDEIEKADPAVLTVFLQVFDDGRLTDGAGKTVDFTHTLIIMTSNLGAASWRGVDPDSAEDVQHAAQEAAEQLRAALRPEFFNRLRAVPFGPLPREVVERIAMEMVGQVVHKARARLEQAKRAVQVQVDPAVYAWLAEAGFTPELGARPMLRLIEATVTDLLAERLLEAGAVSAVRIVLGQSGPETIFE